MSDKFSYNSFTPDKSASELEAIRAQILKQEITRRIREKERERIADMLEAQQAASRKAKLPDLTGPAFVGLFKVMLVIGIGILFYWLLNGAWYLIKGLAKLLV